ncbi:helix-hairpin-helix domain-containing protein [Cellulophaga sp. 20_2_10]|uniref:ComEA family DNA-binding protein n=1 Tax=Cellulophaga sp. 20_2_10 TaxID=2942476 RepID=UPI00201AC1D1|nr:helix-hairpin-helix domain-containing protein [Cellulophaga sp. 20_2_10]MCL5247034.1 helix-hairpin-helix domain-containing protein [Cellulophaga sp. 20_2_10]
MKKFKSHFQFSKEQQSGIFFLLLFIIILQVVYFLVRNGVFASSTNDLTHNTELQTKIDSLKNQSIEKNTFKIYPYNPNYISDYKGYTLGMSTEEIDRLHNYRALNKYVNSTADFKEVTKVSDSLLDVLSPYFKFPDWTKKNKKKASVGFVKKPIISVAYDVVDINTATAEELQGINGIGEKLSARIIKFRDRLGGFLANDQLLDVYGLSPEVVARLLERYKVISRPKVVLIDINSATAYEISKLIYIRYDLAKRMVEYRQENGGFTSFADLSNIEGFPANKIDRIKLYLSIDKK